MKRTIKKLQLDVQTIRLLDQADLKAVGGGMYGTNSCGGSLGGGLSCDSCAASCGGTCTPTCNDSCNTAATSCDFCIRR